MGVVVTTRQGKLEGNVHRGTEVFRGIPFARPPVGDLRFRAPLPREPWQGTRPATRFRPAAPQSSPVLPALRRLIGGSSAGQSEDCLYLNVWTPAADRGRRPVMVWIHGGAFVMGSGSTFLYAGRRLALRGDVVVVTINYRLGALGGLDLRELCPSDPDAPSNLGIRDQIAALEWVRDNIEAFGGDPENVTIFGESAGAMSVGTLLGTPGAQGLFHRAVLQSGAAHNVSLPDQAIDVAESFLQSLGMRRPSLAELREAPLGAILRAQLMVAVKMRMRLGTLAWQPTVDRQLIPAAPLDAIRNGVSKSIPVLIGTNEEEWKLFMLGDGGVRRLTAEELRRRLALVLPGNDASGRPLAERALDAYGPVRSPSETWVAFQSDRIFRYPAMRLAELQSGHTSRTYSYLFTWAPPLAGGLVGSCHGLEIPFVFGTLNRRMMRPWIGLTRAAQRLSRAMRDAWTAFARTGEPAAEGLPDWRPYDVSRRSTMILGSRCSVEDAPHEAERRFWEGQPLSRSL